MIVEQSEKKRDEKKRLKNRKFDAEDSVFSTDPITYTQSTNKNLLIKLKL